MTLNKTLTVAFLAVSLGACSRKNAPPPAAASSAPAPANEGAARAPASGDSQSQVRISEEIAKACGISELEAFFAFDSAHVRTQHEKVLRQLAICFSTGPLKGREMRLVGHADPRGDEGYNMILGERRASNIKGFIARQGLAESRMSTMSRGEMDARGDDEGSWARDRRVDIVLGR